MRTHNSSQLRAHLSEADIEAINRHPKVAVANEKMHKALEAITGFGLASHNKVPKEKFRLIVAYEDALGELREALMGATVKRMMESSRRRH